jgi:hypothetical protein
VDRRILKITITLLIICLLFIPIGEAFAVSKTMTKQYLDFWEGIDAYAWKKAETNSSDTQYRGKIRSFTEGGIIWRIGWNWWSVQQWCGSTPWSSHEFNGFVLYDDDDVSSTSAYYSIYFCSDRKEKVNGKHDFKYGPQLWQPEFTLTMTLP